MGASMSCGGSGVPGKEEAVQITFSWRNAETVDLFIVKRPALFVSCGRRSPFHEQRNERSLSISSLALFSLSVNSTEQRLMRSHLELFSREHVWGKNEENVYVLQSPNF